MAEHLDFYPLARRAAHVLLLYLPVDGGHLVEVELARQHRHVGELRVELQRLDVGYVELRREVHLHSHAAAVRDDGHVACDYRRDARLLGRVYYGSHVADVAVVNHGVHRQVRLYSLGGARGGYFAQVVNGERVGRVRSHVEPPYAEVHRACPGLYRGLQALAAAHGRHYLKVVDCLFHWLGINGRTVRTERTGRIGNIPALSVLSVLTVLPVMLSNEQQFAVFWQRPQLVGHD